MEYNLGRPCSVKLFEDVRRCSIRKQSAFDCQVSNPISPPLQNSMVQPCCAVFAVIKVAAFTTASIVVSVPVCRFDLLTVSHSHWLVHRQRSSSSDSLGHYSLLISFSSPLSITLIDHIV